MSYVRAYAVTVLLSNSDHALFVAAYTVLKFGWPCGIDDVPEDAIERLAMWLQRTRND